MNPIRSTGGDPPDRIDGDTLDRLQEMAESKGVTMDEMLCQLIEATPPTPLPSPVDSGLSGLSPKQRAVFELLKSGLSVKETAERLAISQETVRTHIYRARSRLNCPDLLALRFQ